MSTSETHAPAPLKYWNGAFADVLKIPDPAQQEVRILQVHNVVPDILDDAAMWAGAMMLTPIRPGSATDWHAREFSWSPDGHEP
jgi:hypothetical protein